MTEDVVSTVEDEPPADEAELPRHPSREHREPDRLLAGAIRRTYTEEEQTLKTALMSNEEPLWRTAIEEEMRTLENMNCWSVVKRPRDKPVLHSKFVLKWKRNGDGSILKYKAQLVVCGNDSLRLLISHWVNFF